MRQFNLCLLGFGNVGRALVNLLIDKRTEMRERYGIEWRITGIATRRMGWLVWPEGVDEVKLSSGEISSCLPASTNISEWLAASRPDVLFEMTSLNPHTGQPALSHIRAALEMGAHVVTANKGPLVHGYRELSHLAEKCGRRFLFESTAAHCLPVFSLFRENLPAVELLGFSGILNSTTNIILEEMEHGLTFSKALDHAQARGITETDPTYDIDGFDAAIKVCAIANVLMGAQLRLEDVQREGIRTLDAEVVQRARSEGRPFKLVARATRVAKETVIASVGPEQVPISHPFATITGSSLVVHFELDILSGLSLTADRPNLQSTAYGLLADFINAVRRSV